MKKSYFSRVDFYESIVLLDLGLVDFDNTYPRTTQRIRDWQKKWSPVEQKKYAKIEKETLKINLFNDSYAYTVSFKINRTDLLDAVALLVNLTHPRTIKDVCHVLENMFNPNQYFLAYD